MSFLPKDYKVPSQSNYMKFEAGENIFRIMTDPVLGWEWWEDSQDKDGKEIRTPKRVREEGQVPVTAVDADGRGVKHFWAFVVWNYAEKRLQILEITQKGIQKAITGLNKSKGWGDPKGYDLSVTRTGEGMKTEYSVMPVPPKELDKEIVTKFKDSNINVEALFDGADPFAKSGEDVKPEDIPDNPN